jgi:predicted ATPase/DNA-binding CsgD family transcriptional regulator
MSPTTLTGDEHVMPISHLADADWSPRATRLPNYLTTFIGRERESAQAVELLLRQDVRLLTLTGPGGIGKTRLAVHIAPQLAPAFSGGIHFIPLATITDPKYVLPMIARVMEIPDIRGRSITSVLKSSLQNKQVLLIVDNFEQVIDAAPLVVDLLASCPGLNLIVTSRAVLRVDGEQEFAVPPLSTPERGPGRTWQTVPLNELLEHDAIALFVQRARRIQPAFNLTDDNALAVSEICSRLDGLPLAIELTAARVKVLSPAGLLTRLANSLQLLTGGARDQPERLRTMRNAIAWSYDLLTLSEQRLFQALSVFENGFTMEGAEFTSTDADFEIDILDGISALVDNSLLREVDYPDGDRRFVMLGTVRQFGLEQLGSNGTEADVRRRHAEWCVAFAELAEPELGGAEVVTWLNRLDRENDNLRAALRWLLEHDEAGLSVRIVSAIWMFWFFRSYYREGRYWLERVLDRVSDSPTQSRARTLMICGLFDEAVGEFDVALNHLEESLRIAGIVGDDECRAMAMFGLGDVLDNTGDSAQAEPLLWEAARIFREIDNHVLLITALAFLGLLVHRRGDDEAAQSILEESLELSRKTGFSWGLAVSLNRLGQIANHHGDFERATRLYIESLSIWRDLGDHWRMTRALIDLADVASANQQYERAVRLLGAADALNEPLGVSESFTDDAARRRATAKTSELLDADTVAVCWAAGTAMSWEEAIAEAMSLGPATGQSLRPPVETIPPKLTGREQEVLQLLAAGHSDRQIAESLFISRRTAQGHVAGIFNKLGVNSRTAAATTALRLGLVPTETSSLS